MGHLLIIAVANLAHVDILYFIVIRHPQNEIPVTQDYCMMAKWKIKPAITLK
jgi:hypothetical protein